jgi:hypothetical protein
MQTPEKLSASLRHNIGPPLRFVDWLYVAAQKMASAGVQKAPGNVSESAGRRASLE